MKKLIVILGVALTGVGAYFGIKKCKENKTKKKAEKFTDPYTFEEEA